MFIMLNLNQDIGKRIREIRKQAKLTQPEVGEILGVEKAAISKYEAGEAKRGVPINLLVKIADLGNVSLDYLITGKGPGQELQPADPVEVLIFGNPKTVEKIKDRLRSEVREEFTAYKKELTPDEDHLLHVWRHTSPEIQGAALTILEQSAKESRVIDGGGSGSAEKNSAQR